MSFFKKLFGGGDKPATGPVKTLEYKGFVIEARPFRDKAGQYQLAGTIMRHQDGTRQEKSFIRADKFSNAEDAASLALAKGRQMIDQQGLKIFNID